MESAGSGAEVESIIFHFVSVAQVRWFLFVTFVVTIDDDDAMAEDEIRKLMEFEIGIRLKSEFFRNIRNKYIFLK